MTEPTAAPTSAAPTATKFRKKPVVIEAMGPLCDANRAEIIRWCGGQRADLGQIDGTWQSCVTISTLEGQMAARPGDYVIRGVQGEFYPCKPDIFEATYERVES